LNTERKRLFSALLIHNFRLYQRPWQLYERVYYQRLEKAQQHAPQKKFRFKNKLLTMDATVIDLCASLFDWANVTSYW
jgi:hypothetical protein